MNVTCLQKYGIDQLTTFMRPNSNIINNMHKNPSESGLSEHFDFCIPEVVVHKFNDISAGSNEISSGEALEPKRAISFEEYLQENYSHPSSERDLDWSHHSEQGYAELLKPQLDSQDILVIEVGENYTFSKSPLRSKYQDSNRRIQHKRGQQRRLIDSLQLHSQQRKLCQNANSDNENQRYSDSQNTSSKVEQTPYESSLISSHRESEREISLSGKGDEFGKRIFEQKQLQQEMFLKISDQLNRILELEQKVFYYEEFNKSLLKGQGRLKQTNESLEKEVKQLKKTLKSKDSTIKICEDKIRFKQTVIEGLVKENKSLHTKIKSLNKDKERAHQHSVSKKQEQEKKVLLQQIRLKRIQKQTDEETIMKINNQNTQLVKKVNELKEKNQNLRRFNKILEKEVEQANLKIFELEKEIETIECGKYASNIVRINNSLTENVSHLGKENIGIPVSRAAKGDLSDRLEKDIVGCSKQRASILPSEQLNTRYKTQV